MLYLIKDCYQDENNIYHDILKIGYSKNSFDSSRKNLYDTYNFGYKFLGEKEGSQLLEKYLHRKFSDYKLSSEGWFEYSEEIVQTFWKISENDISGVTVQEDINEHIREYILNNLIPSVSMNKLRSFYLKKILEELKEKDPDYEENKKLYRKEILGVFDFVISKEKEYFEELDFTSQENIKLLEECNLIVGKSEGKDIPLLKGIDSFYKTQKKNEKELSEKEFKEILKKRKLETDILLKEFFHMSKEGRNLYLQKLKRDSESYTHDFVSISKSTNLPVYNKFIEIAIERAWKVSHQNQ